MWSCGILSFRWISLTKVFSISQNMEHLYTIYVDTISEGRRTIITTLLLAVRPGNPEMKFPYGAIKSCAATHNVTRCWTIMRISERALANHHNRNSCAYILLAKNLVIHRSGIKMTFAALTKSSHFIKREPFEVLLPAGDSQIVVVPHETAG